MADVDAKALVVRGGIEPPTPVVQTDMAFQAYLVDRPTTLIHRRFSACTASR